MKGDTAVNISHYTNEPLKIELELGWVLIHSKVDSFGRKTTIAQMFPRHEKGSKRVTLSGYGYDGKKLTELKTAMEDE